MFKFSASVAFSLLGLAAMPAVAGGIDAASHIDHVTVFTDAASVTRVAELDLPVGSSIITFRGLPTGLDSASLHIVAKSDGVLTLGAVENALAPAQVKTDNGELAQRIKALQMSRDAQQVIIETLDAKKAMMLHYSMTSPEKLTLNGKPLDILLWTQAFDAVAADLARAGDELRLAKTKGAELDEALRSLQQPRQAHSGPDQLARNIAVHVDAAVGQKAQISVTYDVSGANWQPTYEARLTSGKGAKLDFITRAIVSQRSGEDWQGVTLEVSNLRHTGATAAPSLHPKIVDFVEDVDQARIMAAPPAAAQLKAMRAAAPIMQDAVPQQAQINASPFQISFAVPGTVSLPGNGTSAAFELMQSTRPVSPHLRIAPAIDPTAYLDTAFTNDSAAAILPGLVRVFRDGAYVGRANVPLTPPGETLDLGFGADTSVKVTRTPLNIKGNEPVRFGQSKIEIIDFKTSIKNQHDFTVDVEVDDQLPVSENTAISVETVAMTPPPIPKGPNDKRGILTWNLTLQPAEAKDIRLAYKMKWPGDRDVTMRGERSAP